MYVQHIISTCFGVINIQESKHWMYEIGLSLNMLFKEEKYWIVKKKKKRFELFSFKWLKKTRLCKTDLVLHLLLASITETFHVWISVVKKIVLKCLKVLILNIKKKKLNEFDEAALGKLVGIETEISASNWVFKYVTEDNFLFCTTDFFIKWILLNQKNQHCGC